MCFFKQKTAYEVRISDWSSDVCSSYLLGGFDELYFPAYCEDADLALKIRDRGYRVIYQPLSVVIHYEGITSGRDEDHGVKSYKVEIGRAACRESVCQYVYLSVVADSLQKK